MILPDWQSFPGGATKRAALWLVSEVGPDGVFTKEQLRSAFPGVTQIDRRVRDLRSEGWVIHTNREDAALLADEQRLVAIGGHVWEKSYESRQTATLSAKARQEVFAADDYACVVCGVSGGEPFPDDRLRRAKLTVERHEGTSAATTAYVTVCDRCVQGKHKLAAIDEVITEIGALTSDERDRLGGWVRKARRSLSGEEHAWAAYRRLPAAHRAAVREWLASNPRIR